VTQGDLSNMSSILKALQKLEKDKETRKTKEPDISTAIKMSSLHRVKQKVWAIPVIVISVATLSILVTFSLMGGFSSKKQSIIQTVQQPLNPQQSPAMSPESTPPPLATESNIPAIQSHVTNPSTENKIGEITSPASALKLPTPILTPLPTASERLTIESPPSKTFTPITENFSEVPLNKQRFKISGIAWQSDNASRIAVINGVSVSEGSNIEGVKIEQIFPDKVKFLNNGKSFEIYLDH